MLKPTGRDTTPIPARSTDRRNRIDRRRLLRTLGGAGVAGLAGCLGDDSDGNGDGSNGEDDDVHGTDDTDEPTDTDDAPEGSEGDSGDRSDDEAAETDTDDEDEAIHPADLEIDPEDGWGEPHDGVEVPDDPGRAVLVIDGERFELEGACQCGEVHAEDEDEERELRGEHGHFTFISGFHTEGEEPSISVSRVLGIGQIAGTSDRSRTVKEFDQFALGDEDSAAVYQFLRYADGETEGVEDDGITGADGPFVRIDPSGVITAVGELGYVESGIDPDIEEVPTGEFEFGAHCQDDWVEGWQTN